MGGAQLDRTNLCQPLCQLCKRDIRFSHRGDLNGIPATHSSYEVHILNIHMIEIMSDTAGTVRLLGNSYALEIMAPNIEDEKVL